ncbi:PLDc N-terminal domain-containing protein [Agromyces mediolanus]|uniref:PLD nuclease N-terminal domain-containing protein n=1 Tax=Agromyces mediolanus TaxID=41986 RepID=UPI00383319A2
MPRLAVIVVAAAIVFWIYTIVDCALFDRLRVRGLRKGWWVALVILVPVIGGVLWFLIGRGRRNRSGRSLAPDDDAEFLRRLGSDAEQEDRIRRLEQELADLDEEPETGDGRDSGAGHPSRGDSGPHDPEGPADPGQTGRPHD